MSRKHTPKAPVLRLHITEDHIIKGKPRDSKHCMIADAVRAVFPDAQYIAADLATIRLTDPRRKLRYTYMTPRRGQVHLVKFDQGHKLEPFSMTLRDGHVAKAGNGSKPRTTEASGPGPGLFDTTDPKSSKPATAAKGAGLRRKRLVKRDGNRSPDVVGGRTPPTQRNTDGVPFSRRRAYGLRALDL